VSKDFIAQTGDPTATGSGGESFDSYIYNKDPQGAPVARYFTPEITNKLKHTTKGTVSMAVAPTDPPGCGSQFFITLADKIDYLDGKHAVFGHVVEGLDTLDKINEAFLDKDGRPLKDIRIRHVEVLEDPYPDPPNMISPPPSPIRPPDATGSFVRIADDEDPFTEVPEEEAEAQRRATAANSSALTLEMIGVLPFAAVRPPENILFVCKLNPITQDEDLELIFSRFGKILSCEIVRDKKTGDSLQYAFIEFDEQQAAEQAYFKMQNVLVDDRRIWVDFSQSVAKMGSAMRANFGAGRGRGGRGGGGGGRGGRGGPPSRDSGYGERANRDRPLPEGYGRSRSTSPRRDRDDRDRSPRRDRDDRDRDDRRSERRDDRDDRRSDRRDDRRRDERDRDRDRERKDRSDRDRRDRDRDRDDRRDRDRDDRRDRDRERDRRDRDRDPHRDDRRDRDRDDRRRDDRRDRGRDRR